jgi:hypothetical protein
MPGCNLRGVTHRQPCSPGRAPEMATRSPEGRHESPAADNEHLEEAPSAKAELRIVLLPADVPPAPETADGPLAALLRRTGFDVRARMTVPTADASEMLTTIRTVTWAVTVVVTIAITLPAGVPITAVIVIVAIEIAGFAIGALSLRRKRAK